jgi:hypothetical protein
LLSDTSQPLPGTNLFEQFSSDLRSIRTVPLIETVTELIELNPKLVQAAPSIKMASNKFART